MLIRCRMPDQPLISAFLFFSLTGFALALLTRRGVRRRRRRITEERQLWVGLAAGLFDASDCPASARLEIALAALARKLGMRGGMVTVQSGGECVIIAQSGDPCFLPIQPGQAGMIPRASVYCGGLTKPGQTLALDYASLTEWRKHPAFLQRGWESYLGVNCSSGESGQMVVCFFDPSPRGAPFTMAERALVQQLAPWIASLVEEERAEFASSPQLGPEMQVES